MRGLDRLIELRSRRRQIPSSVLILLREKTGMKADESCLMVSPTDRPEKTDLRPVKGLRVVVAGYPEQSAEVEAWCEAALKAGALIVMGYACESPFLRKEMPIFGGCDEAEIARRIASLESRYGTATA